MKNMKLSFWAWMCVSSMVFAGGDIDAPVVQEPMPDTTIMSENNDFYVGLALSVVSARESGVSLSFTSVKEGQDRLGNVTLLAGYDINTYLAIEGRYTATVTQKHISEMSGISIFVKPQYDISEELSVYGLLGYGKVNIDNVGKQTNIDVNKGGFQWGLGTNYDVTDDASIFIEYVSLAKDMDGQFRTSNSADVDTVSIGLIYRF